MTALVSILAGLLVVIGSLFTLTAAIGIVRLPDLYTRMHAASKAGTVGSCVMLVALALEASEVSVATRAAAGILFFLLTVPVSSHLLARAARSSRYAMWESSVVDDLSAHATVEKSVDAR